jgi:hypothetical protein
VKVKLRHGAPKKLSHSYPRLLLRPLPVILTVLYFLKVTFALLIAKQK